MIVVEIKGGLGNQLFTYASAYGIARRNNTNLRLDKNIYDTSYHLRKYELKKFPLIYDKHTVEYTPRQNRVSQLIYKSLRKLKLNLIYKVDRINEYEEFAYQNVECKSSNIYLKGYWQDYHYFNEYRNELLEQFIPELSFSVDESRILDRIINSTSVAIHIRRGDYQNFKGGKCLRLSYYLEAIDKMKSYADNVNFFVFTDDVEYCKSIFLGIKNMYIISDSVKLNDLTEFYLMSKCKHFIIANSSFSWWASYLSNHEGKIVVAPVVDMWKSTYYLPEWIKLDAEIE